MENNLLLVCLLLSTSVAFTACAQIKGEGSVVTKTLKVKDFDGVALKGSFNVEVNEGANSLVAKGHGNIIDRLETEVKDGVLILELGKGSYRDFELTVIVTTKMLEKVKVAGSGNIQLGTFSGLNNLDVSVAGSGDLKSTGMLKMSGDCQASIAGSGDISIRVEVKKLDVNIAGRGNVKVSGSAEEQEISITGSGDYRGSKLSSKTADISISGSGDVKVDVSNKLDVSIAGSGNVTYSGAPSVDSKVKGSGDVRQAK
jgi:hypothetical protein